jgi:hypothetical protein
MSEEGFSAKIGCSQHSYSGELGLFSLGLNIVFDRNLWVNNQFSLMGKDK